MSRDRPRVAFDHVQIAVPDLHGSVRRFVLEHGLTAVSGGRHRGRGTENAIVPLGNSYLELIAVVDPVEAAPFPTSMRVARAIQQGLRFAVWAVRIPDLAAARLRLLDAGFALPEPALGSRSRPDGVELRWRMQELEVGAPPSPLPFLIEWDVAPGDHPGTAQPTHRVADVAFAAIRLSDPEPEVASARLHAVLGEDLDWSVERGQPGVRAVVLDTQTGPLTVS